MSMPLILQGEYKCCFNIVKELCITFLNKIYVPRLIFLGNPVHDISIPR